MSQEFEEMSATLYLEDGTRFCGQLFGAPRSVSGEIVFQTGMVGYVVILSVLIGFEGLLILFSNKIFFYAVIRNQL
jgi:carbamoylphosphate synthase small subunit